jgi:hypothetical protein
MLKEGEVCLRDHLLLLPGMGMGITNHFSISGGLSFIPGPSLADQFLYFIPRIGTQLGYNLAASAGIFYISDPSGLFSHSLRTTLYFANMSYGKKTGHLTIGLGREYQKKDETALAADPPRQVLMIGGNLQLGNSVAFVLENWIPFQRKAEAPLISFAIRLFGKRNAVDLGCVINNTAHQDPVFYPLLFISRQFGP